MECEYCKKVLKNKYTLKSHQTKAKYCLVIQEKNSEEDVKDDPSSEDEEGDEMLKAIITILRKQVEERDLKISQLEERFKDLCTEKLDILGEKITEKVNEYVNYLKYQVNKSYEKERKELRDKYGIVGDFASENCENDYNPFVRAYQYLYFLRDLDGSRIRDKHILSVAEKYKEGVEAISIAAYNHILKDRHVMVVEEDGKKMGVYLNGKNEIIEDKEYKRLSWVICDIILNMCKNVTDDRYYSWVEEEEFAEKPN